MATNNAINQIGVLPAFMYTSLADQSNVTGNGGDYLIQFPDKIYDVTSSFNSGTGVFTAPLTGKYEFSCMLYLAGITVAASRMLTGYNSTTPYQYRISDFNVGGVVWTYGSTYLFNFTTIIPLTAAQTISLSTIIFGMPGDTITIQGITNSGFQTPLFSGYMISGI